MKRGRSPFILAASAILFVAICSAAPALAQVPPEANGLAWCASAQKNCLQWNATPTAIDYLMCTGDDRSLACLLDDGVESCGAWFEITTTGPSPLLAGNPPSGSFRWFLVAAVNDWGQGVVGQASAWARRINADTECPGACTSTGTACQPDSDCCTGSCRGEVCATRCCTLGAACEAGAQCCDSFVCGDHGACCRALNAYCSISEECCSGQCNPGIGCCAQLGGACSTSADCCGTADCVNGTCCRSSGAACAADSNCCDAPCTAGVCCRPNGTACEAGSQCCSGECTDGVCCGTAGGSCNTNSDRCGSECIGGSCCRGTSAACDSADDCCEGTCKGGECCHPNGSACSGPGDGGCCFDSRCDAGFCCAWSGAACTATTRCCVGSCDPVRQVCCIPDGGYSENCTGCCSSVCTAGICGAACTPSGGGCSPSLPNHCCTSCDPVTRTCS